MRASLCGQTPLPMPLMSCFLLASSWIGLLASCFVCRNVHHLPYWNPPWVFCVLMLSMPLFVCPHENASPTILAPRSGGESWPQLRLPVSVSGTSCTGILFLIAHPIQLAPHLPGVCMTHRRCLPWRDCSRSRLCADMSLCFSEHVYSC